MRDYTELVKDLRYCADLDKECLKCKTFEQHDCFNKLGSNAADAIDELLAFAKFVSRQAIDTGDNDGVSAEILCRKLNKLGLIETDGEFWMIPTPPKEVE